MKLIEKYIQAKTGKLEDCEDTYFFNQNFAAVIDGATNVSGQSLAGKTPGQIAAKLIKDTIKDMPKQSAIKEILQKINANYELLYKDLGIEEEVKEKPYLRPSASMVLYSHYLRKLWFVGDCQAYFNGTLYQNRKKVDKILEEARSVYAQAELQKGKSEEEILANDQSFTHIKPFIQQQYFFQNKKPVCSLSYAVINGSPIPESLIKAIDIPKEATYLSLASDGYPKIYESLSKSEQALAKAIQTDPLCIYEYKAVYGMDKGNVSFDDRTYIKVQLSS